MQQGTQLSQVFNSLGGTGGGGVLKALSAGFLSIINPVSLATIGIIGLGGAAIQWLSSMREAVPDIDKLLKEHEKLIGEITKAYGEAETAGTKYTETARANLDKQIADQVKALKSAQKAAENEIRNQTLGSNATFSGFDFTQTTARFKPFEDAVVRLNQQIKAGQPDYDEFNRSIRETAETNPAGLEALRLELVGIVTDAANVTAALGEQKEAISDEQQAFALLGEAIAKVDSKPVQDQLEAMMAKAKDGQISIEDVRKALNDLTSTNLDLAGPLDQLAKLYDAAIKASDAVKASQQFPALGTLTPLASGGGQFLNPQQLQDFTAQNTKSQTQVQAEKDAKKAAKANKIPKEVEDSYERFNRQIQEKTLLAEQEYNVQAKINPLVNDYGYALEAARLYQQGLNAAAKEGIDLNPQQLAALQSQTEGLAMLRAEQSRLEEEQDKVKQSFEDWNNTAKEAVGGFIQDLANGVSASEALANALSKVVDQLIQVGLNSIFDSKTGIFGSSGGGLGSIFSAFFGGARANGGPVRSNTPYLVGERGPELFMPGQAGSIIPKMASPSSGSSGGSQASHVTVGVEVDGAGTIQAYVKSVTNSAISQSQKGEVARLPGNLRQVNSRGLMGR